MYAARFLSQIYIERCVCECECVCVCTCVYVCVCVSVCVFVCTCVGACLRVRAQACSRCSVDQLNPVYCISPAKLNEQRMLIINFYQLPTLAFLSRGPGWPNR